jgi:hypothetical protein
MQCSQHITALCSDVVTHFPTLSPCVQHTSSRARRRQVVQATSSSSSSSSRQVEELPGPRNAFVPGQESESRRQLFNRISPVYDEVSSSSSMHGIVVKCNGHLLLPGTPLLSTARHARSGCSLSHQHGVCSYSIAACLLRAMSSVMSSPPAANTAHIPDSFACMPSLACMGRVARLACLLAYFAC